MNIIVDKASSRGFFNHGWLRTYHTFSFADYYNPERIHFGALRVLNDDSVDPRRGFDMHPHKNMEVISIPMKGSLTHGDSVNNQQTIAPGEIQVMSTGMGIYHSEYNASYTEELQFLQIWVFPKIKDTAPEYHNYDIRNCLKLNQWGLFISPDGESIASIQQDAWFSMGNFDPGQTASYKIHKKGNGVYLFMMEGEANVGEVALARRDGAGFWDTEEIQVKTTSPSKILLMEVPMEI